MILNCNYMKKSKINNITIAALGSHSALDICYGAKKLDFRTLVIAQKGREKTYKQYYKAVNKTGCIDKCIILDKFDQILNEKIQKKLQKENVVFIPHRSFEVYLKFNYDAIENKFHVPLFGNRRLLKIEERSVKPNQYDLLKSAGIRTPKIFKNPKKIDRLCLVKVLEEERGFERAFFLTENYPEFKKLTNQKIKKKVFTKKQLQNAVIEEFIAGVQINFNYFYSPLTDELEILGTDTRRQTNLEGITSAPALYQRKVLTKVGLKYEEAGHIAVTVLESMLEQIFAIGERFVKATRKLCPPGIIGPFALQSIITPGPPKKDIVVIDVSPRMPGSPGIFATPYSIYKYGRPITAGERIAIEIKKAIKQNKLKKILT